MVLAYAVLKCNKKKPFDAAVKGNLRKARCEKI
jgi:hypothetical protein